MYRVVDTGVIQGFTSLVTIEKIITINNVEFLRGDYIEKYVSRGYRVIS